METGKVKWISDRKPFGFIQQSNGLDIFFKFEELTDSNKLIIGDEVSFTVDDGQQGPEAKQISKV